MAFRAAVNASQIATQSLRQREREREREREMGVQFSLLLSVGATEALTEREA